MQALQIPPEHIENLPQPVQDEKRFGLHFVSHDAVPQLPVLQEPVSQLPVEQDEQPRSGPQLLQPLLPQNGVTQPTEPIVDPTSKPQLSVRCVNWNILSPSIIWESRSGNSKPAVDKREYKVSSSTS